MATNAYRYAEYLKALKNLLKNLPNLNFYSLTIPWLFRLTTTTNAVI